MATPAPTAEQTAIITAARKGGNLVIEAGAGAGKTSTLRMIADALAPKKGLYIAYNKAIQTEAAASFPANVTCKTAHSLAYAAFGASNRNRLNGKRMYADQAARILGIRPLHVEIDGEDTEVTPKAIAIVVKEAIGRFCNSADRHPAAKHIPGIPGVKDRAKLVNTVLPYVQAAWRDITTPGGRLTTPYFSHDCYLKMWTLTNPQTGYDFILFDEAQDANPAIAYVVGIQRGQKIMVGDRAQAIYGWRGAIDAMQNFKADDRLFLSQSFRFGQAVAEQANRLLALCETPLRLKGFDKILSSIEELDAPNAVLCRTNAGVIESALILQKAGKQVAITGGTATIAAFAKAAQELMDGEGTSHPELAVFKNWGQVQKAVKDGEASDLRAMVNLIDNYGVETVLGVCENSTKPEKADVICSTAHKAKGLEWDAVRLHTDFQAPKEGGKLSIAEAMLLYVAVTRAKKNLDISALRWLDQLEREMAAA